VVVIMYLRKLFNTFLQGLVDRDVKRLHKASAPPGDEGECSVPYLEFIEYFLRFLRLEHIQNEKARLSVSKRSGRGSPAMLDPP